MRKRKLFINPETFSPAASEVWESLSEVEQWDIQKNCPFIVIRNECLIDLRQKGVEIPVLVEISGVSSSAVSRITKGIKPVSFRLEEDIFHDPEIKQLAKKIMTEVVECLRLNNAVSKLNIELLDRGLQK